MPISKDNKSNNQSRRVYNTRSSKMEQKLKKNSESDSSDNDVASTHSESEEEDAMDVHEYRKFLQKIFPSKNLKNKIISGERLKRTIENDEGDEAEEEEEDGEEGGGEEGGG